MSLSEQIIPERILPVCFLLDTSGSMTGERTGILNDTMADLLQLRRKQSEEDGICVRIGVLEFNSRAR